MTEENTTTPAPKPNLLQRLNAVMKAVDYVQKEKKAGMKYSIVSHDAVTAKVRPVLAEHGVVYYPHDLQVSQNGNRTEAKFKVRFANIDDRNDFIDVDTFGYGIDEQDKGPGKAMSYGVKYALLKALGMETGDDPDYEQDVKHVDANADKDRMWINGAVAQLEAAESLKAMASLHTGFAERLAEIQKRSPALFDTYSAGKEKAKAKFQAEAQKTAA